MIRAHCGSSYSGVLPSRKVMAWSSLSSAGSTLRNRHTPLRSTADWESRRCRHTSFKSCEPGRASFHCGYVISSRSPQCWQRKFWLALSLRSPQAIQRNRKFPGRTPGAEVEVEGMGAFYFFPRRYWSVLLIQSARGGLNTSRSTVSSRASALCGMFAGMQSVSPACTTISLPSIQNLSAPSRM